MAIDSSCNFKQLVCKMSCNVLVVSGNLTLNLNQGGTKKSFKKKSVLSWGEYMQHTVCAVLWH